jgi:hypothetical protein
MAVCSKAFKYGQLDSSQEYDCEWNINAASVGNNVVFLG